MDISVLKSPAVLAVLAGSVLITNVVTYNMTAPAATTVLKIRLHWMRCYSNKLKIKRICNGLWSRLKAWMTTVAAVYL